MTDGGAAGAAAAVRCAKLGAVADPGVSVERDFAAPSALVWALLSDTNRYDQALGLSLPRYRWREIDGQRRLVGEAKQAGMAVSWVERPYQWIEGQFLHSGRDFLTGPARSGGLRVEVQPQGQGCRATVTASGEARAWALRLLSPLLVGVLRRRLDQYMDAVEVLLRDDDGLQRCSAGAEDIPPAVRVHEMLIAGEGNSLGAAVVLVDPQELARRYARLKESPADAAVASRIVQHLEQKPDEEVAQIRPFELASAWGLDRRAVLRAFLYATQAGLVDLNWQINCPVCRVSASVVGALADVGRQVHCESCNIQYSVAFGDHVEAVFRCNRALRPVEPAVYCASSPTFRPHVVAQLAVAAGQERTEMLGRWCPNLRVRTLGTHAPQLLSCADAPASVTVTVHEDRVAVDAAGTAAPGASTKLVLRSACGDHYVVVERAGWSADAVLGSVVASMSEFVDLFATEAPAAGLELSIGRLTLLFSDLTGSTALYTEIGDARAFAVVQEHFAALHEAVAKHGGAVVKTMGDAIMATFSAAPDAVAAAIEAVARTRADHEALGIGVKLGVHEGPCLAVRANDRLDFFGTTVNVAARLQGQAETSELVLMEEIAGRPEVARMLQGCPRRRFEAGLKGIEGAQRLVGIDLTDRYDSGK